MKKNAISTRSKKCAARRIIANLLPTHAVPPTHGKWLESLLVIPSETLLVSRIGFGQESFGMKNVGFHPIFGIVLDVL